MLMYCSISKFCDYSVFTKHLCNHHNCLSNATSPRQPIDRFLRCDQLYVKLQLVIRKLANIIECLSQQVWGMCVQKRIKPPFFLARNSQVYVSLINVGPVFLWYILGNIWEDAGKREKTCHYVKMDCYLTLLRVLLIMNAETLTLFKRVEKAV